MFYFHVRWRKRYMQWKGVIANISIFSDSESILLRGMEEYKKKPMVCMEPRIALHIKNATEEN